MPAAIRTVNLVILICAALFASGCSHVNHLREAQDSFNQAAKADNLVRYDDLTSADLNGGGPASESLSVSTGYAATIASIETLKNDSEAKRKLEADGLYGYALAIQSLAYWRLEKWEQAVSTSKDALDTRYLGPRDLALMKALPGLIKNDQAFVALTTDSSALTCTQPGVPGNREPPPFENCSREVLAVRDQLGGALCDIDTARIEAPSGHPVRNYLALSQLAAIANVMDMCEKVGDGSPSFSLNCPNATIRTGSCVKDRYDDNPDKFIEVMIGDVCGALATKGVAFDLVKKSGLSGEQVKKACPESPSP